jgi:hypothetical protein
VIRLESPQVSGTLELIGGREPRSSAQILSGANGEAFLVLPSELRIRSTAASVASYRIVLSADIRRVRIEASGDWVGATSFDVTPDIRRIIPLSRRGRPSP